MVKRIIALLLLLFCANAATAQSFPKPPDVPNYVPVTPVYTTDGTPNRPIDVNVTPPPAYSYELTDIPIPSQTGRIGIGNQPLTASGFCPINTTTCPQAKFRTYVDFSHMLPDDPIRNYGQPAQSHLHCFFGAGSANAYSTYKSLRKRALESTAAGTDANGTGYWYPCVVKINPFADGKNYAIKADYIVVYYVSNDPSEMPKAAHLVNGLRYVFGYEMDDAWAWLQSIINTANATIGHGRYRLGQVAAFNVPSAGFFVCQGATVSGSYSPSPGYASVLRNANGSDPYGGTCNAGQQFWISVGGPDCWDGVNLWSPGGYKHVIPRIYDIDKGELVCPTNYYRIPSLELEIQFTQNGWADRQTWELSSDLAKRGGVPFTAGASFPPGSTFHTDWMNGWDQTVLRTWNHNCLGVDNNVPHQCNSSVISSNQYLIGGFVDSEPGVGGRSPQISTTSNPHTNSTDIGFMLIPPAWNGSLTGMKMCHGTGTNNGMATGPCP